MPVCVYIHNLITINDLSAISSGSCGKSVSPLPIYHSKLPSSSKGTRTVLSCSFIKIRLLGPSLSEFLTHLTHLWLSGTKIFKQKCNNIVH